MQGYEGPDLYHWQYMDLAQIQQLKLLDVTTNAFTVSVGYTPSVVDGTSGLNGNADSTKVITLKFDYSRVGLVMKPDSVTGERRAWGDLQYAYQDYLTTVQAFLLAYRQYEDTRDSAYELLIEEMTANTVLVGELVTILPMMLRYYKAESKAEKAYTEEYDTELFQALLKSNLRLSALGRGVFDSESTTYVMTFEGVKPISGHSIASGNNDAQAYFERWFTVDDDAVYTVPNELNTLMDKYTDAKAAMGKFEKVAIVAKVALLVYELVLKYREGLVEYCENMNKLGESMILTYAKIAPAAEKVLTLEAEGEAILEEREAARVKRAQKAATRRYSDMAHRIWRDEALDTYAEAFDLAQKYTWLAAKAYDYETGGQITAGGEESEFLDSIVGTRLPGELAADGSPMRRGTSGDTGLSDILARMEENWYALKKNLGINNPQTEMTWFSLRTEAFRLLPGADGLNAWRNKLDGYRVSSLRNVASFGRLCQSLRSEEMDEPAIVIPLGTTIDFAKNFFGKDLAGGDHQFSPTYFATKIAEVGVELTGYNVGRDGEAVTSFAETPYVYLIPAGYDRMRAPATGDVLTYDIADQVLPMPNLIGSTTLNAAWDTLYETLTGQNAGQVNVRRYPAFRANGESNASTLIGRSVWNTEWVLVIPGGSLRSDRAKALEELIWGNDDTPGITDVKLGFRTYSHWGK